MKMGKNLKLKMYNCVGDVTHEFEIEWPHDQMERFVSSTRFVLEGNMEVKYIAERDGLELKEFKK